MGMCIIIINFTVHLLTDASPKHAAKPTAVPQPASVGQPAAALTQALPARG